VDELLPRFVAAFEAQMRAPAAGAQVRS
ncbi:hypothetical protein O9204_02480, partial [Treponema pallidum]